MTTLEFVQTLKVNCRISAGRLRTSIKCMTTQGLWLRWIFLGKRSNLSSSLVTLVSLLCRVSTMSLNLSVKRAAPRQ